MISQKLKPIGIFATLLTTGILAGTAAVALIAGAGGSEIRIDVRSETAVSSSNATAFVDVPGANVVVAVPGGANRLFTARFAGESRCSGAAAAPFAWCSLRIIAINTTTGAARAFDPNAGIDYAFDTNPSGAADDLWEGNAMERSVRLPAGQYRIIVQRAVTNAGTTFSLDDWHLAVETNV